MAPNVGSSSRATGDSDVHDSNCSEQLESSVFPYLVENLGMEVTEPGQTLPTAMPLPELVPGMPRVVVGHALPFFSP